MFQKQTTDISNDASDEDETLQLCNDYLFVYYLKNFQESADLCMYNNRELAKIKIKSSYVDDKLKEYLLKAKDNIYRIFLRFKNNKGTWQGGWSNGEKYDV